MDSLPPIRCLRADNPSPLTGQGTNTWLVGARDLVVIDPGPDSPTHLAAILSAPGPGQRIDRIVVTHAHLDHSALAPRLSAATGAPVLAYGGALDGRSPRMARLAPDLGAAGEGLDLAFAPDQTLRDGERLDGSDWTLTALHTPGHLGGHLCLALGEVLFSGDHVMGWSSTVIAPPDGDMTDYLAALHRLAQGRWTRFLPGHGAPVDHPDQRLQDLIAHRQAREAQILQALALAPAQIPALTARIYHDTPPALWPAARQNVLAHLLDLHAKGQVAADPHPHPKAVFHRI